MVHAARLALPQVDSKAVGIGCVCLEPATNAHSVLACFTQSDRSALIALQRNCIAITRNVCYAYIPEWRNYLQSYTRVRPYHSAPEAPR
jgi:hypothetical protein